DRSIRHQGQAFARAVVDHGEDAETAAVDHLIVHKIQGPALVRGRWQRHRRPHAQGTLAPAAAPNHEPLGLVEPINALAIHHVSLAPQQHIEAAVAEPPALVRQLPKSLAQSLVGRPARAIANARPIGLNDAAGPPLAHAVDRVEMLASLPADGGPYHFFDSRSFSATLSSMASASSFFSLPFSSSSALSRRASDTSNPPYFAFHL